MTLTPGAAARLTGDALKSAGSQGDRFQCLSRIAAPALLALLVAMHTFHALHFPLAPDETYYWEWSRAPAWGYYDQGPVIAWLIRLSTAVFGHTQFGVRAGIIAVSAITLWLVYRTAHALGGKTAGLLAMLAAGITPLGMAGGFVATYDAPLALFWAWVLYLLVLVAQTDPALPADRRRARVLWLAAGFAAGMGMLSKYAMGLLFPCVLLALWRNPGLRPWLRRWEPYVALALALAMTAPNVVWQSQNEWVTFRHMLGLTQKGGAHNSIRQVGDFIGSQIGLMTPLLFGGMVQALRSWWRRGKEPDAADRWIVSSLSLPVLVFFVLLAVKTKVQANWAGCAWVGACVAYAVWLMEADAPPGRRRYGWFAYGLAVVVALLVGWPEFRTGIGIHVPARLDQSRKMHGGRELAAACVPHMRQLMQGSEPPVAGAATYDIASRLAFYLPGQPRTFCFFLGTRDNQYRFLNRYANMRPGRNALVVDMRPPDDPLLPDYGSVFERVEPVPEPLNVYVPKIYRDEPVRTYYLYRCYGYRPIRSVPKR